MEYLMKFGQLIGKLAEAAVVIAILAAAVWLVLPPVIHP